MKGLEELAGAGWEVVEERRLRRTWRFDDFAGALAFVVEVGALAEALGHHPDVQLGWGRATIEWTTHDTGGLTARDLEAARRTDEIRVRSKG
jgi:4a-hydroxytetrahydrobiopterin dehydratase